MDLHPIPRQITTFEFKLIGFMTVRQFGYVLLAGVVGYLFFLAIPIKIVNIIVGVLIFSVGLLFAFVPINDRPLDVFVRNLVRRLNSPTQYVYHKNNFPLEIFEGLFFNAEPHVVVAHVDSQEKLAAYLAQKNKGKAEEGPTSHHAHIQALFQKKPPSTQASPTSTKQQAAPTQATTTDSQKKVTAMRPVFSGVVYNKRRIPLPGILLYIRDPKSNTVLRILKTNPHGVFATFHPLQNGDYLVEVVDSTGNYLFDKATISVSDKSHTNLEFVSKETI